MDIEKSCLYFYKKILEEILKLFGSQEKLNEFFFLISESIFTYQRLSNLGYDESIAFYKILAVLHSQKGSENLFQIQYKKFGNGSPINFSIKLDLDNEDFQKIKSLREFILQNC